MFRNFFQEMQISLVVGSIFVFFFTSSVVSIARAETINPSDSGYVPDPALTVQQSGWVIVDPGEPLTPINIESPGVGAPEGDDDPGLGDPFGSDTPGLGGPSNVPAPLSGLWSSIIEFIDDMLSFLKF